MTSQNKKKKARNSNLLNGGEKLDGQMKRVFYYTKRQRRECKEETKKYETVEGSE